jgi:radical SAM enzyme (TIGR01210 family)
MIRAPISWTFPVNGSEACLSRAILSIRSERPHVGALLPFTTHSYGSMIQIWINTPPCRFSLKGCCSICDYWNGIASEDAVNKACDYIKAHGNEYSILLINTCGSCFCEQELPFQQLYRIVKAITKTSIKSVIFESHLVYVDINNLKLLIDVLGDREVTVEYGQESTSPHVLKYCLNKPSMLSDYDVTAELQKIGVKILANVILGSPFLSVRQRIQDAIDSIHSLLACGMDGVVMFPVNIKPYTLVKYLFDRGYYKRVNALEVVRVLEDFDETQLDRIELAWFEPHREVQAAYTERGLSPLYCDHCGTDVLNCLLDYGRATNGKLRMDAIKQIQGITCDCQNTIYDYTLPDINVCYEFLEKNFPQGGMHAAN